MLYRRFVQQDAQELLLRWLLLLLLLLILWLLLLLLLLLTIQESSLLDGQFLFSATRDGETGLLLLLLLIGHVDGPSRS